jgi:hypothetical protein
MSKTKFCFVFICQKGELELKSMLLAASLRENLRGDYELVAAIPEPKSVWGEISPLTKKLLKLFDVRTENVKNEIDINYPIGNKVSCFNIKTDADKIVFLNSDIICLKPFSPDDHFTEQFCSTPINKPWFNEWKQVYELFNMPYPKERFRTRLTNEKIWPCYNTGLIAVDNDLKFSKEWIECCKTIDKAKHIIDKRPWIDQIALPIAVKKLNLKCKILDIRFDHPHLLPIIAETPFFQYFPKPAYILNEEIVHKFIRYLMNKHPLLKENCKLLQSFKPLFYPDIIKKVGRPIKQTTKKIFQCLSNAKNNTYLRYNNLINETDNQRNAIITGIPRSGTSYLCRLLDFVEDTVVINEPDKIIWVTSDSLKLWRVGAYYNILRNKINSGKPIQNKTHNGIIIEDTSKMDNSSYSVVKVSSTDFILIIKNTLAYLAVLPQIIENYPEMPIIACIRNPIDTISSWKRSFPHLRYAMFENFPSDINRNYVHEISQLQEIKDIESENDFEIKRALIWNYLAGIIERSKDKINIFKYEEFVRNPNSEIEKVSTKYPKFKFGYDFPKSSIRLNREVMHRDEIEKIKSVCGNMANKFDYNI